MLTGKGKVFSEDADIRVGAGGKRDPGDQSAMSRNALDGYHSIMELAKPVIAALNSPTLGDGLAIAAFCDILVASGALPCILTRLALRAQITEFLTCPSGKCAASKRG